MTRSRGPRLVVALGLVALLGSGCGSDPAPGAPGGGSSGTGTLRVLAAASLTEPFTTLAQRFERDHPGVRVRLAFDSSATLAEQVRQGAPGDVLATADEATMATVVADDGTVGAPRVFATNHLVLAVPRGNPAGITRFADLDRAGVDYVVCVPSAPCGKLAAAVLEAAGIRAEPVSEEVDVKAVLSKVQLDEADAGLVYASDVATAGELVRGVPVPASGANLNTYPVAALSEAQQPALATAWLDLVTSPQGRTVLAEDGFGTP
ncbi:MAG: molybdate ABC transporter substrate-binding protein [Nocardioidaceae bacterium]